jgi:hypothetical protein
VEDPRIYSSSEPRTLPVFGLKMRLYARKARHLNIDEAIRSAVGDLRLHQVPRRLEALLEPTLSGDFGYAERCKYASS